MSNIQTYLNETLDVKVRTVLVERVIWFCGADVAKALGYVNTRDAVATHCKSAKTWSELQGSEIATPSLDGTFQPQTKFIKRNDLARLVARSQLPSAEAFESWVFDEVLESVFETGSYGLKQLSEEEVAVMYLESVRAKNAAIARANELAIEVAERTTRLAQGTHMTIKQLNDSFKWMTKASWFDLRDLSHAMGHEILQYGTDGATSQNQPAMYHREVCYEYAKNSWNGLLKYRPQRLQGHEHPSVYFGVEMPI